MRGSGLTRVVEVSALGRWSEAWDTLAAAAPLPTPFLRTWWLSATGGPRDHYLLVLQGEELVGGLALERRRVLGVDHFRVLGAGKLCPDHLDLVARPGLVEDVTLALRGWFTAPGSRVVDLQGVRDGARVIDALPAARVHAFDVAVYERLPESLDAYLQARSSSFARRVRKMARQLEKRRVEFRRVSLGEVPWAMAEFTAMHAVRDDRQELVRELHRVRRAVELGAPRDEVRLYVAEKDGRCGAVLLLFVTGGRINVYQTARRLDRDFNHVGTVLYTVALDDACREGITEFDFLRGAEPYKFSLASSQRRLLRVRAAHGMAGRVVLDAGLAGSRVRALLGEVVRRLRRTPREQPHAAVGENSAVVDQPAALSH